MNHARTEELDQRLSAFLRRLSPPRHVAGNPQAVNDEVAALARVINQRAPSQGYVEWWGRFEDELLRRMKTRAWPIVSEVEGAAQAIAMQSRQQNEPGQDAIELAAIDRMASWFRTFRNQMPSHGKDTRTAALIARGVLANEREARFFGFNLSEAQRRRADEQDPCRAEVEHDRRITADLQSITERNAAHREEIAAARNRMSQAAVED